jgi:putative DNA primase/helicase
MSYVKEFFTFIIAGLFFDTLRFNYVAQHANSIFATVLKDLIPNQSQISYIDSHIDFINNYYTYNRHQYHICNGLCTDKYMSWVHNGINWEGKSILSLYAKINGLNPKTCFYNYAHQYKLKLDPNSEYDSLLVGFRQDPVLLDRNRIITGVDPLVFGYSEYGEHIYHNPDGSIRGLTKYYTKDGSIISRYVVQMSPVTGNSGSLLRFSFFDPIPLFHANILAKSVGKQVIISEDEIKCVNTQMLLDNNCPDKYTVISWPGKGFSVVKVDWFALRGREVIFEVLNSPESCKLAYRAYEAIRPYFPSKFSFWLNFNSALDDTISQSIMGHPVVEVKQFVKFAKDNFGVSLDGRIENELILLSAKELLEMEIQEDQAIIPGLMFQPGVMMIFAPSGLGKTWFGLEFSRALVEGDCPFQNANWMISTPKRVLYIDGELILSTLKFRSNALGYPKSNKFFFLSNILNTDDIELTSSICQNLILDTVKEKKIDVVVVDNLASLANSTLGNDASCWTVFSSWLSQLKKLNVSVVLIHHATRKGDSFGTSTKEFGANTIISLEKPDHKNSEVDFSVTFDKARDGNNSQKQPFRAWLNFSEDGLSAVWETMPVSVQPKSSGKSKSSEKSEEENFEQAEATKNKVEAVIGLVAEGQTVTDAIADVGIKRTKLYEQLGSADYKDKYDQAKAAGEASKSAKKAKAKTDKSDAKANSLSKVDSQAEFPVEIGIDTVDDSGKGEASE